MFYRLYRCIQHTKNVSHTFEQGENMQLENRNERKNIHTLNTRCIIIKFLGAKIFASMDINCKLCSKIILSLYTHIHLITWIFSLLSLSWDIRKTTRVYFVSVQNTFRLACRQDHTSSNKLALCERNFGSKLKFAIRTYAK